jgi:hypothetical protein
MLCDFTDNMTALGIIMWPRSVVHVLCFQSADLSAVELDGRIKWPKVQMESVSWQGVRVRSRTTEPIWVNEIRTIRWSASV